MKKLSEQNYYQILEVETKASRAEIIRAFELAEETYGTDSLATYSLMTPEERRKILSKIREAYQILVDDESRKLYDQYLIKTSQILPEKLRPAQPPSPRISEPLPPLSKPLSPLAQAAGAQLGGVGIAPGVEEENYSGKALKALREQKGVDLKQIVQETKINITYLKLLEEDNYALLPAPVYIKGFLVQYARCLGLPPEKVRDGYMKLYAQAQLR